MINAACPSRCVYCGIQSQRDEPELGVEDAVRVARSLVQAGFREVVFVGGEPLLYRHLPAVLDVLSGKVDVALFSGGLPEPTERWVGLLSAGVTRLVLSIDDADEDRNDLVRGRRGVSREVWALAEAARRVQPALDVSLSTVVTRHNAGSLVASWERFRSLSPTAWVAVLTGDNFVESPSAHFLSVQALERLYFVDAPALARRVSGEAKGTDFLLFPVPLPFLRAGASMADWPELVGSHASELGTELERFAGGDYNASFAERFGCPLVGVDISIGVGGEVYPCSQAPILSKQHALGSLRDADLEALLEPSRLAAFAKGVPHAPCRRCWAPSNVQPDVLRALLSSAPGNLRAPTEEAR